MHNKKCCLLNFMMSIQIFMLAVWKHLFPWRAPYVNANMNVILNVHVRYIFTLNCKKGKSERIKIIWQTPLYQGNVYMEKTISRTFSMKSLITILFLSLRLTSVNTCLKVEMLLLINNLFFCFFYNFTITSIVKYKSWKIKL